MFNFNQHELKISTGCCIFAALLCSYSCGRKKDDYLAFSILAKLQVAPLPPTTTLQTIKCREDEDFSFLSPFFGIQLCCFLSKEDLWLFGRASGCDVDVSEDEDDCDDN